MKKDRRLDTPPTSGSLFHRNERNKLIFLSVLLVSVVALFVGSLLQTRKYDEPPVVDELPEEGEFTEQVLLPEFDASELAGKVADADTDDRVLLESGPYDAMFRFVADYGQVYFDAAAIHDLDAEAMAAIEADPSAHRARRYRVRGFLEELDTRTRPDGLKEHRGWVRTEGGDVVHFRLNELEEGLISDDFVRLDGMFLKLHRAEGAAGWEEGPLLVGAQAVRSFPTPEEVAPDKIRSRLALVEDDTVDSITKLRGDAFDANWVLMARALEDEEGAFHPEEGSIEWSAAPELDNAMLAALQKPGGGDEYRGHPFRIPISRNMDMRTLDPGENPARIDRITQGWIGNQTWTAGSGLITFQMPRPAPELHDHQLIQGRGYFVKNLAYEPKSGGVGVVPYFVITTLEPHVLAEDDSLDAILIGVAGITVLLVILIPVLLLRDRRKSEQLQRELVRRRQERRQRTEQASQARP